MGSKEKSGQSNRAIVIGIVIAVIVIGAAAWYLTRGPSQPQEEEPIVIGLHTAHSGGLGVALKGFEPTLEAAADYINNNGGINGREVEIIMEDTR